MPSAADSASSYTILLGDLPLLVAREFVRLAGAASDLRLVGSSGGGLTELAAQIRGLRPAVVVVTAAELPALLQLARPARVLLYSDADASKLLSYQPLDWNLSGRLEPLPVLLAERAAWRQAVLHQLRQTATQPTGALRRLTAPASPPPTGLVVIGASTGGPLAVETLLSQLHPDLRCAVAVAVHLPASFTASLVARLHRASALPVLAARPGSRLVAGQVLVVPGGTNMVVRRHGAGHWSTALAPELAPAGSSDVPSVDLLMSSAATAASRVLGVVLTGLGHDGLRGARAIREQGGQVLVQDAASAAVFSMPGAVLRAGWASAALPLGGLAAALNQFGRVPELPAVPAAALSAHVA